MLWLEKKKLLSYSSHTRKHLHSLSHRRVAARAPAIQAARSNSSEPPAAATSRLGDTNPYRATARGAPIRWELALAGHRQTEHEAGALGGVVEIASRISQLHATAVSLGNSGANSQP